MKNLKPTLVLTLITAIMVSLLIVTYNLTYVDTSSVITANLEQCCNEALGGEGYYIVTDWQEEGYAIAKPDNVKNMIKNSNGDIALEVVVNGYAKNGIDVLVAMNSDGTVKAVSVVSLSETPGLGTKVDSDSFLSQFVGVSSAKLSGGNSGGFYKGEPKTDDNPNAAEIDAVTSATYSSKGVIEAVNIAVSVYAELGGAK